MIEKRDFYINGNGAEMALFTTGQAAAMIYDGLVGSYGGLINDMVASGVAADTVISTGSDLIVDLNRLLQLLYIQPLELTREGVLYRRMEEKLKQEFVLASYGGLGEGRLLELLLALAARLKLVERTDGRLQVQTARVKAWERKDVCARVKRVFEVFLKEHTRDHYSFHQKFLRSIALEELGALAPETFVSARGFVRAALSGKRAGWLMMLRTDPERLRRLIALWRAGALKPAIDSVYALEDADAAFDRFAARGKRGRVLLKL